MRLPTLLAIPDYSAPKKGRGRTRTNYSKALYDPAPKKRGRPKKAGASATPAVIDAPRKRGRPKSTVYQVPPIPKSPRKRGRKADPNRPPTVRQALKSVSRYNDENSIINPLTGKRILKFGATYYKLIKTGALGQEAMMAYYNVGENVRSKSALAKRIFPDVSRAERKMLNRTMTYADLLKQL